MRHRVAMALGTSQDQGQTHDTARRAKSVGEIRCHRRRAQSKMRLVSQIPCHAPASGPHTPPPPTSSPPPPPPPPPTATMAMIEGPTLRTSSELVDYYCGNESSPSPPAARTATGRRSREAVMLRSAEGRPPPLPLSINSPKMISRVGMPSQRLRERARGGKDATILVATPVGPSRVRRRGSLVQMISVP